MRDKETQFGFSWTIAFIISGICYLAVSGVTDLLFDTNFPVVFRWIGMVSMMLGCLTALISLFNGKVAPREQVTSVE